MSIRLRTLLACLLVSLAACGGGGGDQPSAVPPSSGAPGVPTQLRADVGSGRVELAWKGVANVSHYNVYYGDAPDVTTSTGIKVGNVRPPVSITGLINGTTYYFIVTAENSFGEGQASPEISAVPELQMPARVTQFRATPGDGTATLEWDPQLDTDSYNLYWWTDSSANARQIADVSSPLVMSGLVNGVRHDFEIAGVNALGEGQRSGPAHATPIDPASGWTPQNRISELYFDPSGGIPSAGTSVDLAAVAINDSGVAAAAWTIGPGVSASSVMVNHNVGGQWGVAEIMERDENLGRPSVAMTNTGTVVVAYEKDAATIWSRVFENGAWQDPVRIDSMGLNLSRSSPELANDAVGNVFAVWQETRLPQGSSVRIFQVWARRFDAGSGTWGDAKMLVESVRGVLYVAIAAAGNNRAIAGWIQDTQAYDENLDGGGPPLRVAHASYFDGTDWSTAAPVSRTTIVGDEEALEVAVAINEAGDAVAISTVRLYPSGNIDHYELEASRLVTQTGTWSTPTVLRDSIRFIDSPTVAIDASGTALAAWSALSLSGTGYPVEGAVGSPGGSWGAVQEIAPADPADVLVRKWPSGETIAAWGDNDVPAGIYVGRSPDGNGNWGDTRLLGGHRGSMRIAVSPAGHIIVGANYGIPMFDQDGGSGTESAIVVSIYTP